MHPSHLFIFGPAGAGKTALLDALAEVAPAINAEVQPDTQAKTNDADAYQLTVAKTPHAVTVLDYGDTQAPDVRLNADAVSIVVDAALDDERLNLELERFARWLLQFAEARGRRMETGDLPVYVVLNKCDLLYDKGDMLKQWKAKVDERKAQIQAILAERLQQHPGAGFGSFKLSVVATSIKLPAFGDKTTDSKQPFGVAELFRDSALAADDYQERRRSAQSRTQNVLVSLVGVIAILGLLVAFLYEFQPQSRFTPLDELIQVVLPKPEAAPAQRLRGSPDRLLKKLKLLTEIETREDYERASPESRERVSEYRKELSGYLERYTEAHAALKLPHLAKNQHELDEQEKAVKSFTLTEAQATEWADTSLGRYLDKIRKEYESLHTAIDAEVAWIRAETERTNRHLLEGNRVYGRLLEGEKGANEDAVQWSRQLADVHPKPHQPREDNVPGVTRVLWEDLGKFDPVLRAQKEWLAAKSALTDVAKLIEKKMKAAS
jgi:GTPase SAR1 family protein